MSTTPPLSYTATTDVWQRIHDNAVAIYSPQCQYNEDEKIMLRELVRQMRRNAAEILAAVPHNAIKSPSPGVKVPPRIL
jgi:hypothetical protein